MIRVVVAAVALAVAVLPGAAYAAEPPPPDRAAVLERWTGPAAADAAAWNAARTHRAAWARYGFDWSTDYCTRAPERPLGLPFELACQRHDFGYRNYRAAGTLAAHKPRIDRALHADLRRVCARQPRPATRITCNGLAWTYYQATRFFGPA